MRVFVTGGTGHSGPYIISELVAAGHEVTALARSVKAAAAGRVVYAGAGIKAYGHLVIIKHDKQLITAYGGNGKLLVKEGDTVKQGDVIAQSGTDKAGKAALVFEVREDGKPVDPLSRLPAARP